jgi:prepilin-type N-terminal cleavage/methylation domain-containing protein/prepilin-type processing-associated H-X9-DG protein
MKKIKTGFTLVELLVVISIIAMLLAILMPSLQMAKAGGWKIVCAARLRTLGLASQMYIPNNDRYLPPAFWISQVGSSKTDKTATGGWCFPGSWAGQYISGLEHFNNRNSSMTDPHWVKEACKKYFSCPARKYKGIPCYGYEVFSYAMNTNFGAWYPQQGWATPLTRILDVKHPSSTVMHLDVEGDGTNGAVFYLWNNLWGQGYWQNAAFRHAKTINLLMLDGHVVNTTKLPMKSGGEFYWELTADEDAQAQTFWTGTTPVVLPIRGQRVN